MRILTVRQPWAELIIGGEKAVENRSWRPGGVRRIGIHVGLRDDDQAPALPAIAGGFPPLQRVTQAKADRGHVIGTVLVTGYHEHDSDLCRCDGYYGQHADGLYHWTLESPRRFVTPIRARGALGLWTAGPSLEHLMEIAEVEA